MSPKERALFRTLLMVLLAALNCPGAPAHAADGSIPINVAIGPAAHFISGPLQDDQFLHYGLKLGLDAILDQAALAANRGQVPERYRKFLTGVGEVRVSPSVFIPDSLFFSHQAGKTGFFGAAWRPLSVGLPFLRKPVRLELVSGLRIAAAYLSSTSLPNAGAPGEPVRMFFLRPGVDLQLGAEIPISRSVLLGLGWDSQFYIPQKLGGDFFVVGPIDRSIWHIGQAYFQIHFRFSQKTGG